MENEIYWRKGVLPRLLLRKFLDLLWFCALTLVLILDSHFLQVLPYWGNPQDRKTLRKFWGQSSSVLHTEQAEFHILVTSYQLVVQDIRYFQRIKWHYMILDEAQAIKSSSSVRWRLLLGFNCRNRLLLTGTPIQNSMAEVRMLVFWQLQIGDLTFKWYIIDL